MNRVRLFVLYSALLVLGFVYLLPHSDFGISFLDIGFDLSSAMRMAAGQVPYRDFFSIPTPLEFVIMRVLLGVFGNTIWPQLWLGALVISASCTAVFALVKKFATLPIALAAWLATVALWSSAVAPGYTQTAGLFALGAVLSTVTGLQQQKFGKGWFILAGALVALAFWTKQSWGAYLVIGLGAASVLSAMLRRKLGWILAGALVGSMPLGIYLTAHVALDDFVRVAIVHPASSFREQLYQPVPDLGSSHLPADNLSVLVLYAGLAVALVGVLFCAWRALQKKLSPADAALFCTTAALYLSWFERFSDLNARVLLPLTLTSAALLAVRTLKRPLQVPIVLMVCAVLVSVSVSATWHAEKVKAHYYGARLDTPGNEIRVRPRDAEAVRFIQKYFEQHPDQRIAVGPHVPFYYFLSGKLNPTYYDLWLPGHFAADQHQVFLESLRSDVDVVLLDEDYWHFDGMRLSEYDPELATLLETDFTLAEQDETGVRVHVRK